MPGQRIAPTQCWALTRCNRCYNHAGQNGNAGFRGTLWEEVVMPDIVMQGIGEGVTQATVVEWLVAPGEAFAADDILLEMMTDKASFEVPAEEAGTLDEILAEADEEVRIGAVLGRYTAHGG